MGASCRILELQHLLTKNMETKRTSYSGARDSILADQYHLLLTVGHLIIFT